MWLDGKNDLIPKTWDDFMGLLYDIPKTSFNRYRSNYVYRGLADKTWEIKTSLIRLDTSYNIEHPMIRSFLKYAEPGSIPSDNLLVKLSIAQHHGLPTRLLDWTVSPKVALHFATFEKEHMDKDGVIWCVDISQSRLLLPPDLLEILYEKSAYLFSVEMLEHIKTLEEFDKLGKDFLLFFEPPSLDARIVNQNAILSIMPNPTRIPSDYLALHPHLCKRIIIPKELKWRLRDLLDQDNVTASILFPGLDGLSHWLKRYYGPGGNP